VLLSSHALTELEGRADRVVIVNRGVKIADGAIDELRHVSRLPTRIRVRLADDEVRNVAHHMQQPVWRRINGHMLEADASPEEKIMLLRNAASEEAPVADIQVVPPTLDELYAHFLRQQESN
jgi:Cu-processing system ATP-binding protein